LVDLFQLMFVLGFSLDVRFKDRLNTHVCFSDTYGEVAKRINFGDLKVAITDYRSLLKMSEATILIQNQPTKNTNLLMSDW
jgi:hypothetical protein